MMIQYQIDHQVFGSPSNDDNIHYPQQISYWYTFQLTSFVVTVASVLSYSHWAGEKMVLALPECFHYFILWVHFVSKIALPWSLVFTSFISSNRSTENAKSESHSVCLNCGRKI